MSNANLPSICAEMHLRALDGVPVVNSRDVAEMFGKRHDHVLRDISALDISPELGRSWFRPATSLDSYGREQPSFDLTRDGFTLLVMGWTGERAMAFKIRYIEAFNAMEKALNENVAGVTVELLKGMRDFVAAVPHRFDQQDQAFQRLEVEVKTGFKAVEEKILAIRHEQARRRQHPTKATKAEILSASDVLGGRCPCCGVSEVVDAAGEKSRFSELDHYYDVGRAGAHEIWLICKPCHSDLSSGRVQRYSREAQFRAFQEKRQRLPGRQINLFDTIAS